MQGSSYRDNSSHGHGGGGQSLLGQSLEYQVRIDKVRFIPVSFAGYKTGTGCLPFEYS